MAELPEDVRSNRAYWNQLAAEYAADGLEKWAAAASWGIWGVPESQLALLPGEVEGLEAIELGCGTAYVSAWLAQRGARPTGIDNSEAQLATARELQGRFGIEFPLLHANAERVPLPEESFDLAISEYGASIWCDPYAWIPEAARLLRPGGELIFLVNGILAMLCDPDAGEDVPAGAHLQRPLFGMHRMVWSEGPPSVEFHLPHGEMIALLRRSGFEVEELLELRPPPEATSRYTHVTLEWSRRWPCEEVWKARKKGAPAS